MATFNVSNFGAKGDGITNDSKAIQAAVNAAHAAGGGTVVIPAGSYIVSALSSNPADGCIKLYDNITVEGAGMGRTVVQLKSGSSQDISGIFRTQSGVENHDISMRGLTIDGNRGHTKGDVFGFFSGVTPGETGTDNNISLDRIEIKNCNGYGFDPHERTTNLSITNCISHGNKDGFTLDFQLDARLENNIAYNNDRHGFNVVTSSDGVVLKNCEAYGNGANGVTVQRGSENRPVSKNVQIIGGSYHDNRQDGIMVNKADNVTIDRVNSYDNGERGVHIMGSIDSTVKNSILHGNAKATSGSFDEILIESYDDRNGASHHFYRTAGTQVIGNTISGGGDAIYGVREAADGTEYTIISGNKISGVLRETPLVQGSNSFNLTPSASLIGTSHDEKLNGKITDDVFTGGGGNDTLHGNSGSDSVSGGSGNDTIFGDAGNDTLHGNSGHDFLFGGFSNDKLYGDTGNDSLFGAYGDDFLNGGSGNDLLSGGAGNDWLAGGIGADVLVGGAGDDLLSGGGDADRFVFDRGSGRDLVTDFTHGVDRLDISSLLAANFTEVLKHVTVKDGHTLITFGNDVIDLDGFTRPLLATDVQFH